MISLWRIGLTDWHYANRRGFFMVEAAGAQALSAQLFLHELLSHGQLPLELLPFETSGQR